ncbi:MAG: sulfurtransferase TusA family protein [Candidatus Methanomethylicaceae archaeon]
MEKELDLTGLYCPMPIMRTREEIDKAQLGDVLKVKADDPAAEEDLKRWASRSGQEIVGIMKEGEVITVTIRRVK